MRAGSPPRPLALQIADGALTALPASAVKRLAGLGAPLSRFSGRTAAGTALLTSALAVLSQPPKRLWRRSGTFTVEDLAERFDRPIAEIEDWAGAGILGEPEEGEPGGVGRWGPGVVDQAALVDFAVRRGTDLGVLEEAAREGRLVLVAMEHALTPGGRLTGQEVADRAGVPLEAVRATWQALGFPAGDLDERRFDRHEVDSQRVLQALRTVYTEEDLQEATSVVGRAMAEISMAVTELFRRRLAEPFLSAGVGELEIVLRLAAISELTVPTMMPLLEVAFRRHLEATIREETAGRVETMMAGHEGQRTLSVGFADLVGFTAASERVSALRVGAMAAGLLHSAEMALPSQGGRIVKSLGDAVMFTASDPGSAGRAALSLVREVGEHETLPPLRVGIGHGPVLRAYADYFGRTVNIASRLCAAAAPGQVLAYCDPPVEPEVWTRAGLVAVPVPQGDLKGIEGVLEAVALREEGGG